MIIRTSPDVRPDGTVIGYSAVLEFTQDGVLYLDREHTHQAYCQHVGDVITDTEYQWAFVEMLKSIGITDQKALAQSLVGLRQRLPAPSPSVGGVVFEPLIGLRQPIPQVKITTPWTEPGQISTPDMREHLVTVRAVVRAAELDYQLYQEFVGVYEMESDQALGAVAQLGGFLPGNNMHPNDDGEAMLGQDARPN